jgi:hypothetical protein
MADVISPCEWRTRHRREHPPVLGYVRGLAGANVISALFDPGANRKEGDKNITVLRHPQDQKGVWWYQVEAFKDYTFVRILPPSTTRTSTPSVKGGWTDSRQRHKDCFSGQIVCLKRDCLPGGLKILWVLP